MPLRTIDPCLMKALSIITATIGMSFIHSLTTRISKNGELFSNLRFNVRALSSSSIESDILERKSDWIEYMVEFRGVQSAFRLNEFRDSYKQLMRGKDDEEIELTSIIADVLQPNIPVCAYVRLPNESIAIAVAKRCSLVRSISQVWGDAITMEEVRIETEQNYDTLVAPIFKESNSLQDNSWRVDFRRYGRSGRSGLDPEGKKNVLKAFSSILKNMKGVVSLSDAKHNLLYLEDWSSYRSWTLQIDAAARIKADADRILGVDLMVEEGREEDGKATSVTSVTLVEDAAPATTTARVAISENIVPDANTHACVTGDNGVSTEKRVETYEENRIRRNEAIINRNKRNGTLGGDKAAQTNGSSHSGRMDSGINKKERRLNSVSEDTKRNENKKNKGELNSEAFISNNMMRKQNSLYQPSIGEINHDDGTYVPLKCVLARVIAEGPCVVSDFDLKRRPYLGKYVRADCIGLDCTALQKGVTCLLILSTNYFSRSFSRWSFSSLGIYTVLLSFCTVYFGRLPIFLSVFQLALLFYFILFYSTLLFYFALLFSALS